ncbi:MAG: BlaI/MecI/CopY family transcriptional regulator [Thermoanaerobaculia bacterium]|nr:BlaI/MecI/CopY family transcriptional regulator [Thermoanaerobaculia bacterium]
MKLTRNELEILDIFWNRDTATVRDVLDALPESKRPAYTTVQTVIHRLEGKGALERAGKDGNAHLFKAIITRPRTYRRMIREMVDVVGSARSVVSHLVESGALTLEDLRALEQELEERSDER